MTEYITKEQAIGVVHEAIANIVNSDSETVSLTDLEIEIEMTITDYTDAADVVEVVRCEDCLHYTPWGSRNYGLCDYWDDEVYADDYCSNGDRLNGGRKQ